MSSWYVRTGGNNLNSGSSNTDAAKVTNDAAACHVDNGTKVLTHAGQTYVTSGVVPGDAVNLQVAAVSSIYLIASVDSETQLTLSTAPATGDYNYRVGGARATIQKVWSSAAGNNLQIAANDKVYIQAGTYTENNAGPTASIEVYGSGGVAVIDGTGGGAGSDCVVLGNNISARVTDVKVQNAVDNGWYITGNGQKWLTRCNAASCGSDGIEDLGNGGVDVVDCVSSLNTGMGVNGVGILTNVVHEVRRCELADNGSHGLGTGAGATSWGGAIDANVIFDNAGDGVHYEATTATQPPLLITNNTVDGNTGDGFAFDGAAFDPFYAGGAMFVNNAVTNNGAWGATCAVAPAATANVDYNLYNGNVTGARNNMTVGANDLVSAPAYVNAAANNFTPTGASPLVQGGKPVFTTPMLSNIGAVTHGAGGGGYSGGFVGG